MIADKRRFLGGFIMAFAVLIGLMNIVLYTQGRGKPSLVVVACSLLVVAIIVNAKAKKGGA